MTFGSTNQDDGVLRLEGLINNVLSTQDIVDNPHLDVLSFVNQLFPDGFYSTHACRIIPYEGRGNLEASTKQNKKNRQRY